MKRIMGVFGAVALAVVTGCTGISQPKTTALDGQAYRVAVASDRGGAPDVIEMRFENGTLEASDARREGAVPAAYVVRHAQADAKTSFEAETRAPGAVRRFRGTIDGARIEGDLELSRDGVPPARYTFRGDAI
jgi:hypothetical protein